MARFRLCHMNKGLYDDTPYEMYLEGEGSLDDIWEWAHNYYDIGAVVNIMDTTKWIDKTFYK